MMARFEWVPLRKHGDLGLGTFENLDGEMVILRWPFLSGTK